MGLYQQQWWYFMENLIGLLNILGNTLAWLAGKSRESIYKWRIFQPAVFDES